jgi:hypothetical protein
MKNTVKIFQLVNFGKAQAKWISSLQNKDLPLVKCIEKVLPQIDPLLVPYNDLINAYNKKVTEINIKHAKDIDITENTQIEDHHIVNYKYESADLLARNAEKDTEWKAFLAAMVVMENSEVEIEVDYVSLVPPSNILPNELVTVFRGIVISPTWDPNIKII